jgi:hypothetical protein
VVTDTQGGALPGVTVVAIHVASGLRIERTSDNAGRFFLPALPPGEYDITATLSGFRPLAVTGLRLQVGRKIDLPVAPQSGQITDTVTVSAEMPLLRTANAEISEVIDTRQVTQLPLNGCQFI